MVLKLAGVASFGGCRLKFEQICEWIAAAYECTEFLSSLGGAPLPQRVVAVGTATLSCFRGFRFPTAGILRLPNRINDSAVDARVCHARHRRNHYLDEKVVAMKCSPLNLSCR